MLFENLKVDRLVVHEVHRRDNNGPKAPELSNNFEILTGEATAVFCSRLSDALGSASRSIEMSLGNIGAGSMFLLSKELLDAGDDDFIALSQEAARMLVRAQNAMTIPGGLLMVFQGVAGAPPKRYLGLLKAEPQTGFRQNRSSGQSLLEYINKLFLTPDSKVYKIGMFVEIAPPTSNISDWNNYYSCYLFDANIVSKEAAKAATYFYESFLGFTSLHNNAKTTRKFIETTRKFISKMSIQEEKKLDLYSALMAYIRADQSQVISVAEFATKYLSDPDSRDAYESFCKKQNLPEHSFSKDISESKSLLRRRKIKFGNDVQLSGPADKLGDLVDISAINGPNNEQWTKITVKSPLLGENV